MARQWVSAIGGVAVHEDGTEEYVSAISGFAFQEDQAAVAAGRIMSSLVGAGGLAGLGGIAGIGGGLAG